ncbi:MAG: SseB family protein [bacterium]|nr:SseB family protein [bacterium]
MKYKDSNFRILYHKFAAFMLTDSIRKSIKDFPYAEKANCVLTYGYIDHEAGLTLEVLSAGLSTEDGLAFFGGNDSIRSIIRIRDVENQEILFFEDEDGDLLKEHEKKIQALKHYDVSEDIEKSRDIPFLDDSRDSSCIDDVLVYFSKEGLNTEGCWVRISGFDKRGFVGILLNEPVQDFGYHVNDTVPFALTLENNKIICAAIIGDKLKKISEKHKDGKLLKKLFADFSKEPSADCLNNLIFLLSCSSVFVPCNAVMSDEDADYLENLIKNAKDNLDELRSTKLELKNDVRLIPDILQSGDNYFFPAFTSIDEMGEYGGHFSKVQKPFLEVIYLAKNNDKNVSGIVMNAFTEPFVIDNRLIEIIMHMNNCPE